MNENNFEKIQEDKSSIMIDSLSISLGLSQLLINGGFETLGDVTEKEESFFELDNISGFKGAHKRELDQILSENGLTYKK